jgi:hypothetical protein
MDNTEYYFLINKWKQEGLTPKEMSNRYLELNNYQKQIVNKRREIERFFKNNPLDRDFKDKFKELINHTLLH